jgi:TonB family protein
MRGPDGVPYGQPQAATPWTSTLVLSLVLHLVGLGAALALPHLVPHGRLGPPVYVVDLVALPAGALAASPAPPEKTPPAAKTEPPRSKPEKAITLPERTAKKPEPKKTPVPKKTPEPTSAEKQKIPLKPEKKPPETETAAKPEASSGETAQGQTSAGIPGATGVQVGGAGGTGGVAPTDAQLFYIGVLQRAIYNTWRKPLFPSTETKAVLTATFLLTVTSSGRVSQLRLITSSGHESVDRSFISAVQEAMFPPLPPSLGPTWAAQIELTFTRD